MAKNGGREINRGEADEKERREKKDERKRKRNGRRRKHKENKTTKDYCGKKRKRLKEEMKDMK